MRASSLQPGDAVVKGTRVEREQGTGGYVCYVLAVGRFTTTMTPCGRAVVPYAKADTRVCVAEPFERFDGKSGTKLVFWEPRLVSASSLIAYDEWRIKNNAIRKQQREVQRHQARGKKLHSKAAEAVRKLAKAPPGAGVSLSTYPRRGQDRKLEDAHVTITIKVADLKKLPAVQEWLAFLEEPTPDECRL